MARLFKTDGWKQRLASYVWGTRFVPFVFGTNDCATWTAGAVAAMCDIARNSVLTHAYGVRADAIAQFNLSETNTLLDVAARACGVAPEPEHTLATDGDVVWLPPSTLLFDREDALGSLGVVWNCLWTPGVMGLVAIDRDVATRLRARILRI